jgi:putative ABC transport system permease protein
VTFASHDYFATIGTRVVQGRGLGAADLAEGPPVAVVNQTFASRFLSGESSIGRRVRQSGGETPWFEVVGVVSDTRNRGVHRAVEPEVFISTTQARGAWNQLYLLVRADGQPDALLPAVRQVVRRLDPDQPIYAIQTLEDAFRESLLQQRVTLALLSVLSVLALALAALGLYGVMSYVVSVRTQEIGIRMSLGASATDVQRLMLRQASVLAGTGAVLGLAGALVAGRGLSRLLVGVSPRDPVTLVGVTLVLAGVALAAAYLPARRASRIDPLEALRAE